MFYKNKEMKRIYNDTYKMLALYVRRMEGIGDLAEDIIQETYRLAYENIEELYEHPNMEGWLCGTANNLWRNVLRHKERYNISLEELSERGIEPQVFGGYENMEVHMLLEATLSKKDSILMYEKYVDGYSTAEIAENHNISEESIRMKLYRARKKLKKKWYR